MTRFDRWSGLLVLALLLALWEIAARAGAIAPTLLPSPSKIAAVMADEAVHGDLLAEMLVTARRLVVGFAIAIIVGIPAGFALGRWEVLHAAFEPVIEFLRPMPVVAILPLALFILGFNDRMAYAVIAFGAGWIVLLHAMDGIRGVDPVLLDTGRTFRASAFRVFFTIIVPAAAPNIFTGLRVSLGIALAVAVVVELIAGFGGLGTYIGLAQGALNVPETYAGIAVIGILGYALGLAFGTIEHRLMGWHRGFTGR